MSGLGLSLLWAALQATLVGVVAIVLGARPWRIGGAFTPLAALLAIGLLTICSFLPLPGWWPRGQGEQSELAHSSAATVASQPEVPVSSQRPTQIEPLAPSPSEQNAVATSNQLLEAASIFMDELKAVRSGSETNWFPKSMPNWSIGVFALGVAIGLARLIVGVYGAHQIRRRSQPIHDARLSELVDVLRARLKLRRPIELRQADELTSAATLGYFSPAVLLPSHWNTWSPDELSAVMAHELAHIHHRDFAAQLHAQLGLVLHFYNPIVHWLSQRMKLEQELAADALAARLAGGQQKYLRVLASLALDQPNQTVGWPARAFLPTRHSFLRRLEMLRVSKAPPVRPSLLGRMCALAIIALLTIGLITLRPGNTSETLQASEPLATAELMSEEVIGEVHPAPTQNPTDVNNQQKPYDLSYLGEDVELVAGLRPNAITKSQHLKSIIDLIGSSLLKEGTRGIELSPQDIEQVVFGYTQQLQVQDSLSFSIKLTKPFKMDAQKFAGEPITIGSENAWAVGKGMVAWQPDERTIVVNNRQRIESFIQGRTTYKAFTTSKVWAKANQTDAFVLVSGKLARLSRLPNVPQTIPLVQPIVNEAAYLGIVASVGELIKLQLVAECQDDKGVKPVEETINASVTLLKNLVGEFSRSAAQAPDAPGFEQARATGLLARMAFNLLDNSKSQTEGKTVTVTLQIAEKDFPGEVLTEATKAAKRAAERQSAANNLKQIGLAFHNYESSYRVLPQSAITQVSDKQAPKKYPYSWRVALLPYIEHAALYNKYNFEEPWDSPGNLEILKQMPAVYRHPSDAADSTNASYVVLSGAATMFPGDKPRKLSAITDGLSNTVMAVEAKTSIPWTKPEDFEYATDKPIPKLGGYSPEGYNVLLGDGSVRFFSGQIGETLLRAMITASGGETIP